MKLKESAGKPPDRIKISIRLLPEIEDLLRKTTSHQGDLSREVGLALEQFEIVDIDRQVPKIRSRRKSKPTSVIIERKLFDQLQQARIKYRRDVNSIVNGAVAEYLEKQGHPVVRRGPKDPKNGARSRGHL